MTIIRPRLTDYYGIPVLQAQADFAIPFLDEDIPLHVDPFLLWCSPSLQDNSLHTAALNSFNRIGFLARTNPQDAATLLVELSECDEVGLGSSHTRKGKKIGNASAHAILDIFAQVPEYQRNGFRHFEEIQFYVDSVGKDRVSDIFCNFVKSYLIDYTISQCCLLSIPTQPLSIRFYSYTQNRFMTEQVNLPVNPETNDPILFVPKHWLRYEPWISVDHFFSSFIPENQVAPVGRRPVLTYSRYDIAAVKSYIQKKELDRNQCSADPLYRQIPVISAKTSLSVIKSLPTGIQDASDKKYEREASRLLASMLYPHLDFATTQGRTVEGVLIRDLIFYNNRQDPFLMDIWDSYHSRQLIFELKNVRQLERDHINQLNRYMTNEFGLFGILVTRNRVPSSMMKNMIQLWSGQRRCILALTDEDIELMVNIYESKQREPIDVLKMKYAEFMRSCPS